MKSLVDAVRFGYVDRVVKLLREGVDIEECDEVPNYPPTYYLMNRIHISLYFFDRLYLVKPHCIGLSVMVILK